jgi:hypothetical protein
MEGPNRQESFEDFKNNISEIYKIAGWSESLNSIIASWHRKRQEETDISTIEKRIVFQMELAQIYVAVEKYDSAFDTLEDAWTEADQEGLAGLVKRITDLMNYINSL